MLQELQSGVLLSIAQSPALCTTCCLSCRMLPLRRLAYLDSMRPLNASRGQPTNQQSSHMTTPWSSFQWASAWERTGWRNTSDGSDKSDKNGFKTNLDCQAVLEVEGWCNHNRTCNSTHIWASSVPTWWLHFPNKPGWLPESRSSDQSRKIRVDRRNHIKKFGKVPSHTTLVHKDGYFGGYCSKKMMSVQGYDITEGVSLFGKVP